MRPNQQNNKQRSRGRNNNQRRGGGGNPLSRNYESNGPDVKIRGNAAHIAEKYVQLARDAASVGDNVMAENYLQHAEHYFRIILAAQAQYQPRQDQAIDTSADEDDEMDTGPAEAPVEAAAEAPQPQDGEPREGRRNLRQRRPRRERTEEGGEVAANGEAVAEPEAVPAAEPLEASGEEAPKRARRPRRTRRTDAEGGEEGVGELPAFLTAGREAAAE